MSKWTTHVMNVYKEHKKKNPNYKFKDAMKDAKKSYNKTESVSGESKPKKSRKNKSSKKSKKNKSSKKSRKSRK